MGESHLLTAKNYLTNFVRNCWIQGIIP
uniref:Uncharacterized protein n=1 Tax=Arundo donax TaxID=35708 RepID=A0A0A9DZ61_ARUDO